MGKVEKVIVLSVLFLVALILGVTLMVDDPLDKTNVVEVGARTGPPVVAQAPATTPAANAPLLNAAVQPNAAPAATPTAPAAVQPAPTTPVNAPAANVPAANVAQAPAAPALPPGALLKSTEGLQDSWFPDLKLYVWRDGDSWRALADRFYGDWKRLDVLKRHNEGRMDVQPGDTVFVPVFADERARTAAAEPTATDAPVSAAPAAGKSGTPVAAKSGKSEPKSAKTAAAPSGNKFHVVANGESLWKIAKAELGDGNRWKEIYEANRDLLAKPESIKKGMRLRIP